PPLALGGARRGSDADRGRGALARPTARLQRRAVGVGTCFARRPGHRDPAPGPALVRPRRSERRAPALLGPPPFLVGAGAGSGEPGVVEPGPSLTRRHARRACSLPAWILTRRRCRRRTCCVGARACPPP